MILDLITPDNDQAQDYFHMNSSSNSGRRRIEPSSSSSDGVHHTTSLPEASSRRKTSSSIPLPSSHVTRTQSELQLSIDLAAAEERDATMFYRLVNGIRQRQEQKSLSPHEEQPEASLSSILHTRLTMEPPQEHSSESSASHTELQQQQEWQMLYTTRGRVSDASDSWSISGYDNDDGNAEPQDTTEEDEGVFDMDL